MTEVRLSYQPPFGLRMLPELKAIVAASAKGNGRSMNAEIVFQLKRAYGAEEAAAGEGFADVTPAAQDNNAAL